MENNRKPTLSRDDLELVNEKMAQLLGKSNLKYFLEVGRLAKTTKNQLLAKNMQLTDQIYTSKKNIAVLSDYISSLKWKIQKI